MDSTQDNLGEAFSGESQARNKYGFFAEKAEAEGKSQVARIFRAAAEAERVHAMNHAQVLGMMKSTEENLQVAIEGEIYEHSEMYPEFLKKAKEEGEDEAITSFDYAMQVEKVHERLYKKALEAVKNNEDLDEKKMFVCQGCGYTTEGEAPEKCPVCGAPRSRFKKVE
jgi:rubrerythrin